MRVYCSRLCKYHKWSLEVRFLCFERRWQHLTVMNGVNHCNAITAARRLWPLGSPRIWPRSPSFISTVLWLRSRWRHWYLALHLCRRNWGGCCSSDLRGWLICCETRWTVGYAEVMLFVCMLDTSGADFALKNLAQASILFGFIAKVFKIVSFCHKFYIYTVLYKVLGQ